MIFRYKQKDKMPCSLCGQSGHNIRTCMKHHPTKTHSTMTREEWKGLWKNREFIGIVGSIDMLPEGVIQMIGDFLPHKSVGRLSSVNCQLNQDLKEQCKQSKKHAQMWKKCGIKENVTDVTWCCKNIQDVVPLSGLTSLSRLDLSDNYIQDLTPLAGLTALTTLVLNYNKIQDVAPLVGLTALTKLYLCGNRIQSVAPLAGLTELTTLELFRNWIQDAVPLAGLTKLRRLGLRRNQIPDVAPLAGLTALQILYIDPHLVNDIVLTNGIRINPREW
jgi:Leucine-rich repeat (LRR) protein